MTAQEIVKLDSGKVRSNSHLMLLYIEAFKLQFGKAPNCAGCTFSTDFQKLKRAVEGNNPTFAKTIIPMEATYKFRSPKGVILSYKSGIRTIRRYDNKLTEEFVIGFLTNGTPEEISARKKLFSKIPDSLMFDGQKKLTTEEKDLDDSIDGKDELEPEKEGGEQPEPKKRGRPKKS